jgi:hypothetical protein
MLPRPVDPTVGMAVDGDADAQPALPDPVAGGSSDGAPIGILPSVSHHFSDPATNTSLA